MSEWYDEVFEDQLRFGLRIKEQLFSGQSRYQRVEVIDTEKVGKALIIDGLFMTSEKDEHYYHEMIVHPAMTTAPSIRRVLVIGGGDGGTARTVLQYPQVEHVDMVEIDDMVVKACQAHMPALGAWDDPRLHVKIQDAIEYVKHGDVEPYDIILLDGSDPVGPAEGLFNREFYRSVERILAPGGVLALQSESAVLMPSLFVEIQTTLRGVFDNVAPYFGPVLVYGAGQWSWTYCSQSTDYKALRDDRLVTAERTSKYYNRDIHLGAFALPNWLRR